MKLEAVLSIFPAIERTELVAWIERRWVEPDPSGDGTWFFQEIDIARVRLIHELRIDLAVSDDTIPLILSLLDQLHETRRRLKSVIIALESQPGAVRDAVAGALEHTD